MRVAVRALIVGVALSVALAPTACTTSHGVDSGVPRDGGRHLDAPQHDGGTDGGTDANVAWDLAISVTDGDGSPLDGAAWVVVGSDGSRHEGLADALGHIAVEVSPDGAPYSASVAASSAGARSILGITAPLEARLVLAPEMVPEHPSRSTFRMRVTGVNEGEFVTGSGPGILGGHREPDGTVEYMQYDGADLYGLFVFVTEPRFVRRDDWEFDWPIGQSGWTPLRVIRAVEPSPVPFDPEIIVDVSAGIIPTIRVPLEIRLPTEGAYQPRVLYVDAKAYRPREWALGRVFMPVDSGALQPNEARTVLRGDLTLFEATELQPDYLELLLCDGAGAVVGRIHATLDMGIVEVPPADGPAGIEGDRPADVRFSAAAPAWSSARFGLEQASPDGSRTVRWIVVSTSGLLESAALPPLPEGATYEWMGFDTTREASAYVGVQHELEPDGVVRDEPSRPYVSGAGLVLPDSSQERLVRPISF